MPIERPGTVTTRAEREAVTAALITALTRRGIRNSSFLGDAQVESTHSEIGELQYVAITLPREKMHEAVAVLHELGYHSLRVHCPSQIAHLTGYPLTRAGIDYMLARIKDRSADLYHRAQQAAFATRQAAA